VGDLALGVVSLKFGGNGRDNRAAIHDLGLAAGNLLFEATARSLAVHQMIGILPAKARETYDIPQGQEAWTALAIGYKGDVSSLPGPLQKRDSAPRRQKRPSASMPISRASAIWAGARRLRRRSRLSLLATRKPFENLNPLLSLDDTPAPAGDEDPA
jgi:hypothetical protein